MNQCGLCLGNHEDADCPTRFQLRIVLALERIVEILERGGTSLAFPDVKEQEPIRIPIPLTRSANPPDIETMIDESVAVTDEEYITNTIACQHDLYATSHPFGKTIDTCSACGMKRVNGAEWKQPWVPKYQPKKPTAKSVVTR